MASLPMLSTSPLMASSVDWRTGWTARKVRIVLHEVTSLTVRRRSRVGSREDRLCGSALPLEDLQNGTDLISDLGVVVDLALEALEDLWVYHSRGAGHGSRGQGEGPCVRAPSTRS
jgi:hypothetical protein